MRVDTLGDIKGNGYPLSHCECARVVCPCVGAFEIIGKLV